MGGLFAWPVFRPAVRGPENWRELEFRRAERLAVVIVIGEPVALGGLHRLLPARADEAAGRGEHERAAAVHHVFAVLVPVRTLDPVGAADANVVGRGDALAALVEADEEIELPVMLEQRRGLDRAAVATGDGDRERIRTDELAGFRIELAELDPGPERAEGEPGAPLRRINPERVDGVEVVAVLRHHDHAPILPAVAGLQGIERRVGHEPDRARVVAEARQAIVQKERPAAPADRGRPDIERLEPERRFGPFGRAFADHARVGPGEPVRRGLDPDRAMRRPLLPGAEGGEPAVDLDDRRIVDARIAGELRLRLGGADRRGEQ
jgi:hypothetical protein